MSGNWSHHGATGPKHWPEMFPDAGGQRQSPIDIVTENAKYEPALGALSYNYSPSDKNRISNTGHSFNVSVDGRDSLLTGGPLEHKYKLDGFHAHWGSEDAIGSEHTFDGASYAAELHLVHWNSDLYSTIAEAVSKKQGLAVLGILISVGKENPVWKTLLGQFPKIQYKGSETEASDGFDPTTLLPENVADYYTYPGSLTTPPCYESVTWIVFRQPVEMSPSQLTSLRKLKCIGQNETPNSDAQVSMVDNFRPPQSSNGRQVLKSFC